MLSLLVWTKVITLSGFYGTILIFLLVTINGSNILLSQVSFNIEKQPWENILQEKQLDGKRIFVFDVVVGSLKQRTQKGVNNLAYIPCLDHQSEGCEFFDKFLPNLITFRKWRISSQQKHKLIQNVSNSSQRVVCSYVCPFKGVFIWVFIPFLGYIFFVIMYYEKQTRGITDV